MDRGSGNSASENYNPRETASIFSILTFFYNYQILKKGERKEIEETDIYRVIPEYEAQRLGDQLESQWKYDKKRNENASISKCLIKCFGWPYVVYTIVQVAFSTGVTLLTPTVISKFVAYFQQDQTAITTKDAYMYAGAIIGISLFSTLFNNNLQQLIIEYSIRVRTAICSLLFRKALKLSPVAFSEISVGRIVTLISKDVFSIDSGIIFMKDIFTGFLQLGVTSYILYRRVGVSAFPAIGVFFLILPIQIFAGKKTTEYRIKSAKRTDIRFKLLQETLGAIKIIKMYTWEKFFEKLIHAARLKETDKIKIVYYLKAAILVFGSSSIGLAFYVLLISYIARGYTIEAETIYYVQTCLGSLKMSIGVLLPVGIAQTADMFAALQRIQTFLDSEEVDKSTSRRIPSEQPRVHLDKVKVAINDKEILKSVSLDVNGGLLLITGNVGSGKSALLKTILGEYPVCSGNLLTKGTFSYATEQPWLFPSTIRQNILFGEPYNEERYQEVINVCALTYDINKFEKLDQTIVGDKGINLSKGQQARITLARAVYRKSDIYLLDDCLSSLDNHVNKHIFTECIKGFLKNKLCVLVTNNINNIKTVSNSNILFIEDGRTLTLEQQRDALDKRITYYIDEDVDLNWKRFSKLSKVPEGEEATEEEFDESDTLLRSNESAAGSKELDNLYHEEKKTGKVLWNNYVRYFRFFGGMLVTVYLFLVFAVSQFCISYADKSISLWVNLESKISKLSATNQSETNEYDEALKSREQFLNIYTILTVSVMILLIVRSYSIFFFCINAARKMHKAMVEAMLNATMYFFDDHFIGNIINRLSKDIQAVDEHIPFLVYDCYRLCFNIVGVFILVASVNWIFFIPAALLLLLLCVVQRFYLPTSRSLRRLEAASRSPIIGYLNSTLEGLPVVRAAQQQNKLQSEFDRHQDLFTSTFYMNQSTTRFFSFVLDVFGIFFTAGVIVKFVVFPQGAQAGDVGLALTNVIMLSALVQYAIRQLTEVENVMTSVERVLEYTDVKLENKSGRILENWPSKGSIRYDNVSLTYKSDGNTVLKNISFEIEGQTKIGIVGRTGAGKSSIVSTLFRLYDFDGDIFIDNRNISSLSLDYLRSKIAIIPQDPTLFSGTIRANIDPFSNYSDANIWSVLEEVHMKSKITNLNQSVSDSSTSFSSGEKQLICLARALIQHQSIIVLDEATANLDPETDQLLQKTVQKCFRSCTVITIAHRLHSITSCDKVLVLDAGRIVEFDEPNTLMENSNGFLFKMVAEDGFVNIK